QSVLDSALAVHQASLEHNQAQIAAATIPVENIRGRVLVAAGGADRVWPSMLFAKQIADRRAKAGLETTKVLHAQAGHRAVLPGEEPAPLRADLPRGGTPSANAEHGAQILRELLTLMPTTRP
ncbi:MAG: acyl-CoA thioester hydrolase/BAAT C-terminal domain-containing protein, partial [Nocardioides sp.]|uniref:acyl-CoA thioester hydrolase/BAAT C-terminal domain-containing protein n=1 Tax=Nocardioides sp. TaxID=35761 RepID=UPI003263FA86